MGNMYETMIQVSVEPNDSVRFEVSNLTTKDGKAVFYAPSREELIMALGGTPKYTKSEIQEVQECAEKEIEETIDRINEALNKAVNKVNFKIAHIREFNEKSLRADGMQDALDTFIKEIDNTRV